MEGTWDLFTAADRAGVCVCVCVCGGGGGGGRGASICRLYDIVRSHYSLSMFNHKHMINTDIPL